MKCQSLFPGKKNIINLSSAEFAQRVTNVLRWLGYRFCNKNTGNIASISMHH